MSAAGTETTERPRAADRAAYWLTIAGIYFLIGVLFFYYGKGKLFTDKGKAPPALAKQFAGTFIDTFPGINAAWVIIGILEFLIFVLLLISLVRGEFLPHKRKAVQLVSLRLPPNGPANWLSGSSEDRA